MNRDDLRQLAQIRLREARALLKNRSNHGAYYLCGYVIECGLKACIAKQTKMYDFPDKETVNKSYTHDLSRLVKVSGLERDLDSEMTKDTTFALNWAIVKDWSEENTATWTPSQAGTYTIVVRASTITDDSIPPQQPIAGMTCTIGE